MKAPRSRSFLAASHLARPSIQQQDKAMWIHQQARARGTRAGARRTVKLKKKESRESGILLICEETDRKYWPSHTSGVRYPHEDLETPPREDVVAETHWPVSDTSPSRIAKTKVALFHHADAWKATKQWKDSQRAPPLSLEDQHESDRGERREPDPGVALREWICYQWS